MFRPDRRWFSIASIGLVVVAAIHGLGHWTPPPDDPRLASLVQAMREYRFDFRIFGMKPAFHDIHDSLGLFLSIALAGWGVQNLAIASVDGVVGRSVRAATIVSAVTLAAVLGLFLTFRNAPPFVMLFAVEVLFIVALLRLGRAAEDRVARLAREGEPPP
jgi:cation transport ATPase